MALTKIATHRDIGLENFYFYAHILNEYAKEENKKTADWPTFHKVLLRKSGEYLFSTTPIYLMIVTGYNNMCCF